MDSTPRRRRILVLSLVFVSSLPALAAAQAPAAVASPVLTPAQMEAFLASAKVIARKTTKTGVTRPVQATLSDGTLTHDAQIQAVDESRPVFEAGKASEVGFRDTYKFNIAAYRLAQILGIQNVPMSVERRIDSRNAAVTWWVDNVGGDEGYRLKQRPPAQFAERVSKYLHIMRVWDELIQNRDRNQGNMLWTRDWTLWMIDHTRAFRTGADLRKPDELTRIDRALLEALRRLSAADMEAVARGGMMTKIEADAVLKRRDRLVQIFDDRIATRGAAAVLFELGS
jgi:hypothetical protein